MNQSILEKIFNKIPPIDGILCVRSVVKRYEPWMPTEDIKETFKILTQQQNHEIQLCKKDLQNTLRRKGK